MTDINDPLLGKLVAIEGRDDWLFLDSIGPLDVIGFYTDVDKVPDESLRRWAEVLKKRREYFADKGIAYQTLIAPDSHTVYRDKLPEHVVLTEKSPFERLSDLLDDETRQQCVYPVAELVAAREVRDTYQSVDVHWSDWGGWIAYLASIEALAKVVPAIRPMDAKSVTWSMRPTYRDSRRHRDTRALCQRAVGDHQEATRQAGRPPRHRAARRIPRDRAGRPRPAHSGGVPRLVHVRLRPRSSANHSAGSCSSPAPTRSTATWSRWSSPTS